MQNYIQRGENITVPAPAAVTSGDGVLLGALFGVANGDADPGADLVLSTTGVFELPKATTDEIAIGDPLYWDATAGKITVTTTDNTFVGYAVSAAANPSGAVRVRLSV